MNKTRSRCKLPRCMISCALQIVIDQSEKYVSETQYCFAQKRQETSLGDMIVSSCILQYVRRIWYNHKGRVMESGWICPFKSLISGHYHTCQIYLAPWQRSYMTPGLARMDQEKCIVAVQELSLPGPRMNQLFRPLVVPLINKHLYSPFFTMILQVCLYSAMWKPDGRRFELIATFSDNIRGIEWVSSNKKPFPNIDYGFNKRVFKISTNIVSLHGILYYSSICLNNKETITYSVLISPCFAWHPYEKLGLIKSEQVIGPMNGGQSVEGRGLIFGNFALDDLFNDLAL